MVIYLKCKDTILNSEFRNKNLEVWNTDFRNWRNDYNFSQKIHGVFFWIVLKKDTPRRFTFFLALFSKNFVTLRLNFT